MRAIIVAAVLFATGTIAAAQTTDCRSIADSLERLRCYDGQAMPPATKPAAPPQAATSAEDPFIAKAKARVKQQLLDADSARFQDVKVKIVGGKKGICGQVNAKNSTGGMTGFLPFTYDGEFATIMVFNAGAGNPTSMGSDILGITLHRRLEAHDRFCT
jgi:hypothetical protein